ncbi:hypothetical protein MY3296_009447 [Beauveria thailandica]
MGNKRNHHYNSRYFEHDSSRPDGSGGLYKKTGPFPTSSIGRREPIQDPGHGHGRHHEHLHQHHHYRERSPARKRAYPDGDSAESHRRGRNNHESQPERHCGGIPYGQMLASAAVAGAVEAVRKRHDKDQAVHVVTAAVTSAAAEAAIASKGDGKTARHVAESAVTGLAMDRLLNGKGKG